MNHITQDDTQDPLATQDTIPKGGIRGLNEPFKYAPSKPDGDPWEILLKPELEADRMQCDAWKEEVQTLLIFAGLFSAVVTAFVIESYRFLQPDPNDTIIGLLTQIANGPNATSLSPLSASTSSSKLASFSSTSSSVRINVFWFFSLILSLTTVLVGTIALQWLREHQSYPGFSPKQILAALRMRSKALKAWYVPQIFATLPLLLQSALMLFLVGLIDFTQPLGMALSISITCVIALVILFFVATTILPAVQGLCLLTGYFSRDAVPSPCAFKSPQAQLFYVILGSFLRILSFIFPKLYLNEYVLLLPYLNQLPIGQRHLFPHIYKIWHCRSWPAFDLEWLSLRDAWHHGILDKCTDLFSFRMRWKSVFPLSDITQCLVKAVTDPRSAKHTGEFLAAACYCFQEVSKSICNPEWDLYNSEIDHHNIYFEQLLLYHSRRCSLATFLIHTRRYEHGHNVNSCRIMYFSGRQSMFKLFHTDHIYRYLDMLLKRHRSPILKLYRMEIKSRMIFHILKEGIRPLVPVTPNHQINEFQAPALLEFTFGQKKDTSLSDLADLLMIYIEDVVSFPNEDYSKKFLYSRYSMIMFLDVSAHGIMSYSRSLANAHRQDTVPTTMEELQNIGDKYGAIFCSISEVLKDNISHQSSDTESPPCLLFYTSAILLKWVLLRWGVFRNDTTAIPKDSNFSRGLSVLVDTLASYKTYMDTAGGNHERIKTWLNGYIPMQMFRERNQFSEVWWESLFQQYRDRDFRVVKAVEDLGRTSGDECAISDHAPTNPPITSQSHVDLHTSAESSSTTSPASGTTFSTRPPSQANERQGGTKNTQLTAEDSWGHRSSSTPVRVASESSSSINITCQI